MLKVLLECVEGFSEVWNPSGSKDIDVGIIV
jgi:hypothetical protein